MGFLPEAMRNYLARLGWSHGNDEFFTTAQAIEWFDLTHLGKAPARFDFAKLENLSGQHIRAAADAALLAEIDAFLAAQNLPPLTEVAAGRGAPRDARAEGAREDHPANLGNGSFHSRKAALPPRRGRREGARGGTPWYAEPI